MEKRFKIFNKNLFSKKVNFQNMKKEKLISIIILSLGLVFEWLYYAIDNTFFDVKFYLLGILCIIIGSIGVWIYVITPFISDRFRDKNKPS